MRTMLELERFLMERRLSIRIGITRSGFHVDLFRMGELEASGHADGFVPALDEALTDLARASLARSSELRS